jgi:hypothetical protein
MITITEGMYNISYDTESVDEALHEYISRWGCQSLAEWASGRGLGWTVEQALAELVITPCPNCASSTRMMPPVEAYEMVTTIQAICTLLGGLQAKAVANTNRLARCDADGMHASDFDNAAFNKSDLLDHHLGKAAEHLLSAAAMFMGSRDGVETGAQLAARLHDVAYPDREPTYKKRPPGALPVSGQY